MYLMLSPPYQDFSEFRASLGFAFVHPSGLQGGVTGTLVQQSLKDRASNPFGLVDLRLGYEFPHKRGLATFEVANLFDRRFFLATQQINALPDLYPGRRMMFKLALYF
jgi:outer membrane receptor protein involved in Fe transport